MPRKVHRSPESVALGAEIARARKAENMSQVELARRVGIAQQSVGDWERGFTAPRGDKLDKLFHALPKLREALGATEQQTPLDLGIPLKAKRHLFVLTTEQFDRLNDDQRRMVQGLISLVNDAVSGPGDPAETSYDPKDQSQGRR
jgi:transcriptional regulator with XRE-family HTH domain